MRTLLIGLGRIGMGYDLQATAPPESIRTHSLAFTQHEGFSLVGGVDPDAGRRAEFTRRYSAKAFPSTQEALAAVNPQIIVIATPTESHPNVLDEVLPTRGLVAILCEKPLATTSTAAERMRDRANTCGVSLFVNYIRRATPGAALVRAGLESGGIRGSLRGVVTYSDGLRQNGTHMIDLLQYWLGEPTSVQWLPSETHDRASTSPDARLSFDNAEILLLGRQSRSVELHSLHLSGPDDVISFADMALDLVELRGSFASSLAATLPSDPSGLIQFPIGLMRYQMHVVQALHIALRGRVTQLTTADEAVRNLRIIDAILGEQE